MALRHADSQANHQEHELLLGQLHELESALNGLICYAEVYADLGTAAQVYQSGRRLQASVPRHFQHEEQSVLDAVAALGPDWSAFCKEMKRQHQQLCGKLKDFCAAMDELEDAQDLEESIADLKQKGEEFSRQMASHMGAEERRLEILTNA